MAKYKCKRCGYAGEKLIFQFNDYNYCVASNEEAPDYIADVPQWVRDKGFGESDIKGPVGCLECQAWGIDNFEEI